MAAAHVAAYQNHREGGLTQRIVITRRGQWQREVRFGESDTSSWYSNFRTNLTIMLSAPADGRLHLQANQRGPAARIGRYSATTAGQRDHLLGERCDVRRWRDAAADGPTWENCQTRDGIELWSRVFYRDGSEMESTRAVRITRSHVPDASPPANMLQWQAWAPPEGSGPNDEVVMDGGRTQDGRLIQMIVRRRAALTWTSRSAYWGQQLEISGGGMSLRYSDNAISTGLSLSRGVPAGRLFAEPASTGRQETVLGRTCVWFDMMPGVADAGRLECHTEDGMLLKYETTGLGLTSSFSATQVRIGGVTGEQMRPPEAIFAWLRSEAQH
jgi:hypothetical protein